MSKTSLLLLFMSGVCFGWALDDPHSAGHWFGFVGGLFGALIPDYRPALRREP